MGWRRQVGQFCCFGCPEGRRFYEALKRSHRVPPMPCARGTPCGHRFLPGWLWRGLPGCRQPPNDRASARQARLPTCALLDEVLVLRSLLAGDDGGAVIFKSHPLGWEKKKTHTHTSALVAARRGACRGQSNRRAGHGEARGGLARRPGIRRGRQRGRPRIRPAWRPARCTRPRASPGSGAWRGMKSSYQMTAEPSSRTRLYAARQASLSILVAIAAGPQRDTVRGGRARPWPAAGMGARRVRAEGARAGGGGYGDAAPASSEHGGGFHCGRRARGDPEAVAHPAPPRPLAAQAAARLVIGRRAAGAERLDSPAANPSPEGLRNSEMGAGVGALPPPSPSSLPLSSPPTSLFSLFILTSPPPLPTSPWKFPLS